MTQPTVTEADIRAEARRICEEEGIDPPYGVMGELVLAGVRAGIALARRITAEREAVVVACAAAAAAAAAAEAENAKVREALAEELAWHEGEAKALSKQPPRPELEWPKHQHRERIEAITAALETDNG